MNEINLFNIACMSSYNSAFLPKEFTTEWVVSGNSTERTITLPLYNLGTFNCIVDWGDNTQSSITSYDDLNRIHTFQSDGTYIVKISGDCPSWSFNKTGDKTKITKIISWGDGVVFTGFKYLENGFNECFNLSSIPNQSIPKIDTTLVSLSGLFRYTNIESIPEIIFNNLTEVTTFLSTFANCSLLTQIPMNLFKYNINVSQNAFNSTFANCSSLISIPSDLFKYNTQVSLSGFNSTFYNCRLLTQIPMNLFKYNTQVSSSGFQSTFQSCTSLEIIPSDLFKYNTQVSSSGFWATFSGCSLLSSIPVDLFRYNINVRSFRETFKGCSIISSIPVDLFRYNVLTTTFQDCFRDCINLENISINLFKYNTKVTSFYGTFYGCNKLQLNSNIFYSDGEQSSRFLNKSVNFTNCFARYSFTGTQGIAPDLWNCNFGTGTLTSTGCFSGTGNDAISISNYNDIPSNWK